MTIGLGTFWKFYLENPMCIPLSNCIITYYNGTCSDIKVVCSGPEECCKDCYLINGSFRYASNKLSETVKETNISSYIKFTQVQHTHPVYTCASGATLILLLHILLMLIITIYKKQFPLKNKKCKWTHLIYLISSTILLF